MSTPSRFTRFKIVIGYLLLLAAIIFALLFIHKEMQNLSVLDTEQGLKTDSLLVLLRQKDENTIRMLQTLSEANEKLLSMDELEQLLATQDTLITQQRVQHRMVTKRDSVVAPAPKKSFFKRLGEVFVPSKDTAVVVNTTLELTTDTLLNQYNPADSLQQRIKEISEQKRNKQRTTLQRTNARLRSMNALLTARIDSLFKAYQDEALQQAEREAQDRRAMRRRSTQIIGSVAIGAVLLAAIFIIIVWRDITRSNRYRRRLEAANRRAEELLKARENLMLTITHDFKAPLGSIIGYIDMLNALPENGETQKSYLRNMKNSSDHLLKLVSDLLDFHRLDLNKVEVNRVRFNPAQLFDDISRSFEPLAAAKHLEFRYKVDARFNATFIGDPLRIRQIANNLLSNAIKFTERGNISLTVNHASSRLIMAISDTGKGMEPEDRERIFQEFTRLAGAQGEEGFGLGLSIVSKLVQLLDGRVQVHSTPGRGSTFTVSLPVYPVAGAVQEPATSAPEPAPEVSALRVLLIDDDKIQLQLTAAMLARAGLTAVCCDQPDALIEHLRTETFDVLLTDVQMPAMDGFTLIKLLRSSNIAQARHIPIIAVTARSEMQEGEFTAHGFAAYLNKPFSANDLLRALGKMEKETKEKAAETETATEAKTSPGFNLAALTSFSDGDEEASRAIIESFRVETNKNLDIMQQAIDHKDMNSLAAMAHKLTPIFTMIEAHEVVQLLGRIERRRSESFSSSPAEDAEKAITLIRQILAHKT